MLPADPGHFDVNVIFDCLAVHEEEDRLYFSLTVLKDRFIAKCLYDFDMQCVGGFVATTELDDDLQDDRLPLSVKQDLLIHTEKEFASDTYDIKLFELRGDASQHKFRVELFGLSAPERKFVGNFSDRQEFSSTRLLLDKFCLIDNKEKIDANSLVLMAYENAFPHYVEIALVEPSSKIEWIHRVGDTDCVFRMAEREAKELMLKRVFRNADKSIMRDWQSCNLYQLGEQEEQMEVRKSNSTSKKLLFANKNFKKEVWSNFSQQFLEGALCCNPIYTSKTLQIRRGALETPSQDLEINIKAYSNKCVEFAVEFTGDDDAAPGTQRRFSCLVSCDTWTEGSRAFHQLVSYGEGNQAVTLQMTVEVQTVVEAAESIVRFSLTDQHDSDLFDLLLMDFSIFEYDSVVREDIHYPLNNANNSLMVLMSQTFTSIFGQYHKHLVSVRQELHSLGQHSTELSQALRHSVGRSEKLVQAHRRNVFDDEAGKMFTVSVWVCKED